MSLSTPFIQRPIATSLLMVGIFLIGLASFPTLPVAARPQVDIPTIQVIANLPGASAEIMASSVAQPLEYQLSQIPGFSQMTSASLFGSTRIAVQFDLNRNIDAAQDAQSAIDTVGDPADFFHVEPHHGFTRRQATLHAVKQLEPRIQVKVGKLMAASRRRPGTELRVPSITSAHEPRRYLTWTNRLAAPSISVC